MFDELNARGLVKQKTFQNENLKDFVFYIGFDPTADSLHVGHLVQLMFIKRVSSIMKPIVLIGDQTALIGDPSGRSSARPMLSIDDVDNNTLKIKNQIKNICGDVLFVNNRDFYKGVEFCEFISKIGSHFKISEMVRAECFKQRISTGLTFLEFSYMLMQANDFMKLNEHFNCVLQVGGDDQWSNILAGINLIKKIHQKDVFGLTLPLLINSNGEKMGKTKSGAVFLDETKTTPLDFFNFWRNIADQDLQNTRLFLSDLSVSDIRKTDMNCVDEINNAKENFAFEMTKLVHGDTVANFVLNKVQNVFKFQKDLDIIVCNSNDKIIDVMCKTNNMSKTFARNLIKNKAVKVDGVLVSDFDFTFNKECVLSIGKKQFFKVEIK